MKRLLCILNSMDVGGAETFLMKVYREIDRKKYQFDFCLCSSFESFYEKEIKTLGGRIFHIPSKSDNYSAFKRQLFDIVKENGYIYVLKITANSMGMMDLKICKRAGAKICCVRSSNSSDIGGFKMKFLNWLGRILYLKYADVKIAPSKEAGFYTFGKKSHFEILKNGIDVSKYSFDLNKRKSLREKLNINDNQIVIGHIGRFHEQKNHEFLIRVFEMFHENNPNSVLLLVGCGKLMSHYQQVVSNSKINSSVLFVGQQTDIQGYLSSMDFFVFPSLFEGTPNTVIEAQANGLSCLVSNSITKEACVSDNCYYLPLNEKSCWVESLTRLSHQHIDNSSKLLEHGYFIEDVIKSFIDIIFNNGI